MDSYALIGGCKNGNCPKVFVQGNRVFVQGATTASEQFDTPTGEAVVEIPLGVLQEAARKVLA